MGLTKKRSEVINLSKPLRDAVKKVKRPAHKMETVKPGLVLYDKRGLRFNVEKVVYKKKDRRSSLAFPTLVILKSQKIKNVRQIIKKVTPSELASQFKTFNVQNVILDTENPTSAPQSINFYTANPVVAEKPSYLNNLFKDDRPTRMSGIIAAIQEQIKKDTQEKNRRESDVSMIYKDIQDRFNGFITKSGWFSDKLSSAIVFIDWLGEECRFKEYKESTFEKKQDYNVVIVYTRNKTKSFFINLLKMPILKYSTTGGK